jgi:signal transduction histidine kinase/CheY-like chemotaxis protein
MKKAYLFLFFISSFSFAQYEEQINSLYKIINSDIELDKKADAYGQLIEIHLDTDPSKSENFIKKLYELSKKSNCIRCEIMADFYTANFSDYNGNGEKAVAFFEKAAQKSLKSKDYEFYQLSKVYKIYSYFSAGDIQNAENEIKQYLEFTTKLNLKTGHEEIYYASGLVNHKKGFYNKAVEDLLLADKIIVDTKLDKLKLRATILDEIALTYKDLKNYTKAIEYNTKSIGESQKNKDIYGEMSSSMHRGRIEIEFFNYKNALVYLNNAYKYFTASKNPIFTSICELNLGIAYYHLKEFDKSNYYLDKSIKVLKSANNRDNYAKGLTYLAKNNLKSNHVEEAKKNIDLAKFTVKEKQDFPFYLLILETEIDYFKQTANLTKAFEVITQRDSLSEIILNKSNINNLNELEAKYQNEKKEGQIKLLSAQNELAQKQKYIYIGIVGLLLLIGGSLFYAYRNKIKTAQKLNELNELKSRFFANISHEFRTPLTLIKSPMQSLQSEISDVDQKNKLQLIDTNATRMLALVDQLLALSKIDSGKLKLILKDGNIGSFLTSIIEPFEFQSKEKGILFTANIQKTVENSAFDKDVIEKIVTNLVSNAFKYSPENESIVFTSSVENSNLKVVVSNTGSELKKEDLPKLFERFYQKNQSQQGVGIGLALVKELVELYKGTITTSLENMELSFIVDLPLTMVNENAVIIPPKDATSIIENTTTSETELPILLVVDDNADIRNVLKDIFKQNYQILEAEDGEQALKIALKEIPDCIISDVMMPKMDGFEFTKQIKTNELTSFIPILLLTAKTSDEAHLQGLKSTADAFLTKPFNNEIVKETVLQLIAERKKLQERYSQELVLRPTDIVINSIDEKFVARLQKTLDEHVSNAEFSSDDFARAVGMSRMQLHRKLKTLFGVSTTEFLRNERLKIAAELLRKENGNISDVAYAVGFNDVSYFSKCFKELYQCTPTEFVDGK